MAADKKISTAVNGGVLRVYQSSDTHSDAFSDHPISEGETVIGRTRTCDVRLNSTSLSREHCRILIQDGDHFIMDLNAQGGCTRRRQHALRPHAYYELTDGIELTLGDLCCQYYFTVAKGHCEINDLIDNKSIVDQSICDDTRGGGDNDSDKTATPSPQAPPAPSSPLLLSPISHASSDLDPPKVDNDDDGRAGSPVLLKFCDDSFAKDSKVEDLDETQPYHEMEEKEEVLEPTVAYELEEKEEVLEPTVAYEEEVLEPTVAYEEEVLEPTVAYEEEVLEPTVAYELEEKEEVLEPTVAYEEEVLEPTVVYELEEKEEVLEPTVAYEEEVLKPTIAYELEEKEEVLEPTVAYEEEVLEPTVAYEEEVLEPTVAYEEEVLEPTIAYELEEKEEVLEPTVAYEEEVLEPTVAYEMKEKEEATSTISEITADKNNVTSNVPDEIEEASTTSGSSNDIVKGEEIIKTRKTTTFSRRGKRRGKTNTRTTRSKKRKVDDIVDEPIDESLSASLKGTPISSVKELPTSLIVPTEDPSMSPSVPPIEDPPTSPLVPPIEDPPTSPLVPPIEDPPTSPIVLTEDPLQEPVTTTKRTRSKQKTSKRNSRKATKSNSQPTSDQTLPTSSNSSSCIDSDIIPATKGKAKRGRKRLLEEDTSSTPSSTLGSVNGDESTTVGSPAKKLKKSTSTTRQKKPKVVNESLSSSDDKDHHVQTIIPRVMFTGVIDEGGQKIIKELGGELVDMVTDCTHLVTDKIRRTVKFLCCLGRGCDIISIDWLLKCKKEKQFTCAEPFIINDIKTERQYQFSLKESIIKARVNPLLKGWNIYMTDNIKPSPNEMKDIITSAGGKVLEVCPSVPCDDILVVSCDQDVPTCQDMLTAGVRVCTNEVILTGILRQELEIDKYKLIYDSRKTKTPTRAASKRRK